MLGTKCNMCMSVHIYRAGKEYSQTTLVIPTALRNQAREQKISMSALLAKAIENEIELRGNGSE